MDSRPSDKTLLLAVAERNMGAFRTVCGRVRYDGPVTAWTGTGRYRNVGAHVRDDVEHAEPSLEDAYLLLLRGGTTENASAREAAS